MTNVTAHFRQLISRHMGLDIPDKDESILAELLTTRSKTLAFPATTAYCHFLETNQKESEQEWMHLAHQLTIGESYFFRDAGQMRLLEQVVIPELLEKNAGAPLRLLSAGCSTGEEPFSIAMLIDGMLSQHQTSNMRIFGIDINEEALRVARNGKYSNWSFRGVSTEIRTRYFHKKGANWQLDQSIRDKVTFRRVNLVKDPLPSMPNEIHNMDLILCRNVNIYFNTETVTHILDKLVNTLNPGGYLITGHAELQGIIHPLLRMRSYPESVIFQRIVTPQTSQFEFRAPSVKPRVFHAPPVTPQ